MTSSNVGKCFVVSHNMKGENWEEEVFKCMSFFAFGDQITRF